MQEVSFEESLDRILEKDPRYRREVYFFVREALDYTQKMVERDQGTKVRHVSGQQLLAGVREFALSQFGPMVITVLEEWGVRSCEDFGEIVFNMVESGVLAKTEQDSRADFQGGYSFDEAFRKPFLPAGRGTDKTTEPKATNA
jgi:uncharacterized repeat protein (TIGR04138 family)